jgi:hypothetical protein
MRYRIGVIPMVMIVVVIVIVMVDHMGMSVSISMVVVMITPINTESNRHDIRIVVWWIITVVIWRNVGHIHR